MTNKNMQNNAKAKKVKGFIIVQSDEPEATQSRSKVQLYFFRTIDLTNTPSYDAILPGLYLGNAKTVNTKLLKRLAITHVLTVQEKPLPECLIADAVIKSMFIDVPDAIETNLKKYFRVSNSFIDEGIREGAVLVHCHLGVSRSATLVIAYLMFKFNMTMKDALELVRDKRPFVNPNPGFMHQLQEYEESRYRINSFLVIRGYMSVVFTKHKCKILSTLALLGAGMFGIPVYLYYKKPEQFELMRTAVRDFSKRDFSVRVRDWPMRSI